VYDHAAPIGEVVVAAPFQRELDVVFRGRSAHAGINPEDGRSAILAAAKAIADLRLGRLDEETTANVGVITGGAARNVVPDHCSVVAEARSRDEGKLLDLVQEMLDTFAFAASVCDCEVEARVQESYRGYRLSGDHPALGLAFAGLERAGFTPRGVEVGGGADASVFNARGVPCVVLANGMEHIHSPEEQIAVADLEAMVEVTLGIVDAARSPG
jgi:tripeptide aminopeptidase